MAIEVRNVATDEEFDAWCDSMDVGFYTPHTRGEGPRRRERYPDLGRIWAGYDGALTVGTLAGLDLRLTVPGGAQIPLDGISGVTVAPTHRRQGLARRMMAAELSRAKERGDAMAALVAAEYPIYGRFGYGPATESAQWVVDARDLRFVRDLPGRVELIDAEVARFEAAALYDRIRRTQVGAVSREGWRWDVDTGQFLRDGDPAPLSVLHAVCRDESGQVVGYAAYRFTEKWTNQRPDNTVYVSVLVATDPLYEARLWKHLADHDWVTQAVGPEFDRIDPLWRDLLVDRRMIAQSSAWDFVWLRVLDPAVVLSARTYAKADRIVLRVEDKDGYAAGTYVLRVEDDGTAVCALTLEPADVTLPVDRLGEIYLGGHSAARLGALGLVEEHTPGAVERLSTLFSVPIAPHNPMIF
ncbi:MAG TPA: GNAT family N-acetyltransferase [Actinospica sp.]|jgi:predicted acetyltransferase|nr:GNAT family N-acetyltransferase [Actinospica sp.]